MCFQLLLPEQSHVVLYIILDYMAKLLRQTVNHHVLCCICVNLAVAVG